MTTPRQLITPECVILQLEESQPDEVIQEMITHLVGVGKLSSGDCHKCSYAVLERESNCGTGLGSGVAIPHGRVAGLKHAVAVLGRSEEGIDFSSPDNAPSHLVCLLLVPEEKAGLHLQTLAELAKIFRQCDLRERLEKATTADEICQIFSAERSTLS